MFVDHAGTREPEQGLGLAVSSIYCLRADHTYRVRHLPVEPGRYILLYTLAGEGSLRCGGKHFRLTGGEALLMSPREVFHYETSRDKWNFWWFEFTTEAPPFSMEEKFDVSLTGFYLDLCDRCMAAMKQGDQVLASTLLAALARDIAAQIASRKSDVRLLGVRPELFARADHYVRNHLREATVASLAQAVNAEERTLRNLFSRYAGCPPKEYILRLKLGNGKYMLENTTKSVGEIAEELGFSSPFHFSRRYREHFGKPPSAVRGEKRCSREE